jgi:hypothetical protein
VLAAPALAAWFYFRGDIGESPPTEPTRPRAAKAAPARKLPCTVQEFARATAAQLDEWGQRDEIEKAGALDVTDFSPEKVVLIISYDGGTVVRHDDASSDISTVAIAAVKTLMNAGWNPRVEKTVVRVEGRQPGPKTITGGDTIQRLGRATYSWADDKVEFEADE